MAVNRGCGCTRTPTDTRFAEDGTMEVSFDGGATWQDATSANDPRLAIPLAPPLPGADDAVKECNASQAAVEYYQSAQAELATALGTGATLAAIIAVIIAILVVILSGGTALVLTGLFFGLASQLVGVTETAFNAAFTAAVWDRLLCNFSCHIQPDGSFTEPGWQAVKMQVSADENGLAERFLYDFTNSIGYKGLTNAARSNPDAVGDCSTCFCGDGCNLDNWYINDSPFDTVGVVVSKNQFTGVIVVASTTVNVDGTYRVQLEVADPINQCCYLVEMASSTSIDVICHWPCGTAPIDYATHPCGLPPTNQCIAMIEIINDIPFTSTLTFGACP